MKLKTFARRAAAAGAVLAALTLILGLWPSLVETAVSAVAAAVL